MAIAGSHLVELFDSGESSDEEEKDELQDLSTVAFNDDQFRQHFRVKRETFEMIICHLGPQKKYNNQLASVRCVVERAFALLKGRFRRLKFLDMNRTDLVPKVIMACCIMHNLCIDNTDIVDDDVATAVDDEASDECDESHRTARSNVAQRQLALAKRNAIAAQLWVVDAA